MSRDINFHGSPDADNTISIVSFDYSTLHSSVSWLPIERSTAPQHPHVGAGYDDANSNSIPDILELDNTIRVTSYFKGSHNNDLVFAMNGVPVEAIGMDGNDRMIGGTGNDSFNGGNGADLIEIGAGNDTIQGGAGNDRIYGGSGNDSIQGNSGDDTIFGDPGADAIDGNSNVDTLDYGASTAGVSVLLNTGTGSGGDAAGDSYAQIENVNGSSHADTLTGGTAVNTLIGRDGNDAMNGASGNDSLNGGNGNDALLGGADDDGLTGGAGTDTLSGNSGFDTLTGNSGTDTFVFQANWDQDTVTDFADTIDKIDLRSFGHTNEASLLALAVEVAGNVTFTFGGGHTLTVIAITKAALSGDILFL